MAKNLLSCSPLYLTVIVVCICFVDAHQLGLQKRSTDDANKGGFLSQSGVEKVLTLIINQQGEMLEMIKSDRVRAEAFQSLILEMIKNDRERAEAFQSLILEMIMNDRERAEAFQNFVFWHIETTNASINDLHAEIESLKKIVQLLLEKIEILEIREPSSDSTAFEIMLSTGKWVGIGYYAASLICEFGFLDGLPIVSGMKAVICPFVKMPSFKFSG